MIDAGSVSRKDAKIAKSREGCGRHLACFVRCPLRPWRLGERQGRWLTPPTLQLLALPWGDGHVRSMARSEFRVYAGQTVQTTFEILRMQQRSRLRRKTVKPA